jgi:multicomponent Na+:H+ antiporter subunit A
LIQNGSLPSYIGIISLVAVLLPATALVGAPFPASLPPTGGVLEVLLAVVILSSAAGLLFIRRRFAAVILLGGVGYGVAGLYAVLGGPDLSLTQLLVETLAIALFALVLRHLPATFAKPRAAQLPRVLIAAAVGVFVFAGGLLTAGTQSRQPVSDLYLEASVPEAGGANVVNVILVDFRGFDTLGEITVLATAALGAAALVIPILRRWKTAAP